MKAQLNNGLFPNLPKNLIISCGKCDGLDIICNCEVGKHLAIVENEIIIGVEVWSDWVDPSWHEDTNFQIKFTADDLLDLLEEVPAMIEYTKTLTTYRDMMFRYFYVNFFNDMERELLERYGGVITERRAE